MKKLATLLLVSLFCASLALTVFAADVTKETAVGYVFKIDDINGAVTGEDSTIVTDSDALAKSGSKWAIWFLAEKVEDNVYKAISNGTAMGGTLPVVAMEDDQIIVIVHSASSDPEQEAEYPNWEAKVSALAVKIDDYLILDGIDLVAKTSINGTITVATKAQYEGGEVSIPVTSEPDESTPEEESSEAASTDTSIPVLGDQPANVDESDPDVKSSDMKLGGGFWDDWKWVFIGGGAGVLAVVAAFAVGVIKKKK